MGLIRSVLSLKRVAFAMAGGVLALASLGVHAQTSMRCNVPQIIPENQFPFDIRVDNTPLVWSADHAAQQLYRDQERMFMPKGRSFVNRWRAPPSMGLYDPHLTWTIEADRRYTKLIDGRYCAQMTKVTLVAHFAPEVQLAHEMQARSCVAKAAFNHQLLHDKAMRQSLKDILAHQDVFKKVIYPIYSTMGAAGSNMQQIDASAKQLEKRAGDAADNIFVPYELNARQIAAETPQSLNELSQSCNGEFADLAKTAVSGKPIDPPKNKDD